MSGRGANKDKKLKCPECGSVLSPVYAKANYGRVLLLDQCPGCGGTWFDKWELYFLKDDSVGSLVTDGPASGAREAPVGLGALDIGAFLGQNRTGCSTGLCPVCSKELKPFTDPMLPADASINRCAACSGLWLNRGALTRYAEHRAEKRAKNNKGLPVPAGSDAEGQPGAGPYDAGGPELETLKNLQKELDASTLAAQEPREGFALDAPPIEPKEFARDVGVLILQALLRLVFKI